MVMGIGKATFSNRRTDREIAIIEIREIAAGNGRLEHRDPCLSDEIGARECWVHCIEGVSRKVISELDFHNRCRAEDVVPASSNIANIIALDPGLSGVGYGLYLAYVLVDITENDRVLL